MITIMYSNYAPSDDHLARLERLVGPGRVGVAHDEEMALALARDTEIILGHRYLRQTLPFAVGLRWVQSSAAGFDHLPIAELARRGITLTRNPTHAEAIAHHGIALAWSLLRQLPSVGNNRSLYTVRPAYIAMPALPRTALVIGLGEIGTAVAQLLRGMGLYVRAAAGKDTAAKRQACDEFVTGDHWRATLADTDLVVLTLPLNDETRHCLAEDEIATLPSHALVVNIARAGLVDLDALVAALDQGHLGGAALDALDPAMAADDRFWQVPNLLITPKCAAFHPAMQAEFERFAEAQLARYLNDQPLAAAVDLHPGRAAP